MKKFYEVNVTDMDKAHLRFIYRIISNRGWDTRIDDLEMVLDDNENILIRGWATKKNWNKFYKIVINSDVLDYLFETEERP